MLLHILYFTKYCGKIILAIAQLDFPFAFKKGQHPLKLATSVSSLAADTEYNNTIEISFSEFDELFVSVVTFVPVGSTA